MHCDVIVLGQNDVKTAWIYWQSIGHFTDLAFVKRMQMLNTT